MIDSHRRVAITGLGIISPVGLNKKTYWDSLAGGISGVAPISLFDASGFPTQIAAEVKGFDPAQYVEKRKSLKLMMRDMQFAVAATREAVEDAAIDFSLMDPARIGVIFGAGMISTDVVEISPAIIHSLNEKGGFDIVKFGGEGIQQLFPLWLLKQLPNMLASHVAIAYNTQGPSNTVTTRCSASAHAMGEAFRVIERGGAELIITGGASSFITPLKLIRFHKLGALSRRNDDPQKASRPFDAERDGLVIGEGAGILVFEELEHALNRGARIYAEIVGYGSSVDILSGPGGTVEPSSKSRAILAALADAKTAPEEVDYICAHGNSLPVTDRIETLAIKDIWKERAYAIPVSSVKGNLGDMGPASGAVGLISALLAIENRAIPATMNYEKRDPECDLDYVPDPRNADVECAVCNSFDFLGQNVSLIVKRAGFR